MGQVLESSPWAAPEKCCAPKALESITTGAGAGIAMGAAAALAVAVIAVWLIRRALIRRTLSGRETYDLLPTSSFDPTPEDVSRFAAQLTRARPAESRLRPRRAASVRICARTEETGRLLLRLSGTRNAGSVLRHQTYAQVELRRTEHQEKPGG